jgi:parallel beta-helix repeat protein
MRILTYIPLVLAGILLVCTASATPPKTNIIHVTIPNPKDAYRPIQTALLQAKPGNIVQLPAGRFDLYRGLSLATPKVTLRGKGMKRTILSFKGQIEAAQGFRLTAPYTTIEKIQFIDTPGNAIAAEGTRHITFREIATTWSPRNDDKAPYKAAKKDCPNASPQNGSYGFYPVFSEHVLIEKCVSSGASDSGIYIGQSSNVIVRNNHVFCNVAGIEIENTKNADVYGNTTTKNTGGILVFKLPLLPRQYGSHIRVFNNKIIANNTLNFAPKGATVGMTPDGAGMMIVAAEHVEIFNNTFKNQKSFGVMSMSYLLVNPNVMKEDPNYQPFSNNIQIHDNTFENIGYEPSKNPDFAPIAVALMKKLELKRFPVNLFDGSLPPPGQTAPKPCVCVSKNKITPDAKCSHFVNFQIYGLSPLMALKPGSPAWLKAWAAWKPSCENKESCQCSVSALPAIKLKGVQVK